MPRSNPVIVDVKHAAIPAQDLPSSGNKAHSRAAQSHAPRFGSSHSQASLCDLQRIKSQHGLSNITESNHTKRQPKSQVLKDASYCQIWFPGDHHAVA